MRRHKKSKAQDSAFFWSPLRFLEHELPAIRKKSQNTVASYRTSLNICIDYLEDMKGLRRERICYRDLNKDNLKIDLVWMGQIREWSPKTCNLRPTVISGYYPGVRVKQNNIHLVRLNTLRTNRWRHFFRHQARKSG